MTGHDHIKFSTPFAIGSIKMKNRVVLAPLTRNRATMDLVPTDRDADVSMLVYYEQRASAGEENLWAYDACYGWGCICKILKPPT